MSETIPMSAADLVVHGTFDLRCALDRRATRAWHAELPVSRLEQLEVQIEARPLRERPGGSILGVLPPASAPPSVQDNPTNRRCPVG